MGIIKAIITILLILFLLLTPACGGGGDDGPQIDDFEPEKIESPTDRFVLAQNPIDYGYYLSGGPGQGLLEFYPHTTFTWMHLPRTDAQYRRARQSVKIYDQELVFSLGRMWLNRRLPVEEYKTELRQRTGRLRNMGLYDDIYMSYLLDEPYQNWGKQGLSNEEAVQKVQTYAHATREIDTESKMGVILYPGRVGLPIPDEVDYVGVACYRDYYACEDGLAIWELYAKLRDQLESHQKMFMVPPAFSGADGNTNSLLQRNIIAHQMARGDPEIVAVVPFIWWSHQEGSVGGPWRGARDIPKLRTLLTDIGKNRNSVLYRAPEQGNDHRTDIQRRDGLFAVYDEDFPHLGKKIAVCVDDSRVRPSPVEYVYSRKINEELNTTGIHGLKLELPSGYLTPGNEWKIELFDTQDAQPCDGEPNLTFRLS